MKRTKAERALTRDEWDRRDLLKAVDVLVGRFKPFNDELAKVEVERFALEEKKETFEALNKNFPPEERARLKDLRKRFKFLEETNEKVYRALRKGGFSY